MKQLSKTKLMTFCGITFIKLKLGNIFRNNFRKIKLDNVLWNIVRKVKQVNMLRYAFRGIKLTSFTKRLHRRTIKTQVGLSDPSNSPNGRVGQLEQPPWARLRFISIGVSVEILR